MPTEPADEPFFQEPQVEGEEEIFGCLVPIADLGLAGTCLELPDPAGRPHPEVH